MRQLPSSIGKTGRRQWLALWYPSLPGPAQPLGRGGILRSPTPVRCFSPLPVGPQFSSGAPGPGTGPTAAPVFSGSRLASPHGCCMEAHGDGTWGWGGTSPSTEAVLGSLQSWRVLQVPHRAPRRVVLWLDASGQVGGCPNVALRLTGTPGPLPQPPTRHRSLSSNLFPQSLVQLKPLPTLRTPAHG